MINVIIQGKINKNKELKKIYDKISDLKKQINYINNIKGEFLNIEVSEMDLSLLDENENNYIGKGKIKNLESIVYFKKSDIKKIIKTK